MSEYQVAYDAVVRAQRSEREALIVSALQVGKQGWFRRLVRRFRRV